MASDAAIENPETGLTSVGLKVNVKACIEVIQQMKSVLDCGTCGIVAFFSNFLAFRSLAISLTIQASFGVV